jgi:tetratricopeptide (TPR) repeat protein
MVDMHEDDDFFIAGDSDSKIKDTSALMTVVTVPYSALSEDESAEQHDSDVHSEDESDYYDEDDGCEQQHDDTHESVASHQYKAGHHRGHNGRRPFDHTPPDRLLRKAEQKVAQYIERKQLNEVVHELIRCTALARLVYGDRHWCLARAHTKLASGYLDLKGYTAQAIYHTELAENTIRNQPMSDSYSTDKPLIYGVLVEMYYTLGRALTMEKKLTEADAALSKAEKILHELSGLPMVLDDDIEDWTTKLCLASGRLNFHQQKYAVSITYFERAIDMMQKRYGSDSPQLISVYQSLGRVEQGKGKQADHMRAIEHFLQAYSIATASFDENGVEVAETGYALALAYTNVGNEDAENSAESYFRQSLATYETLYRPSYERVLEIKDELSRLMIRTDRIEEAITLLQSTVEPKQDKYGDLSPQVAETWKIIGNSHLSMGNAEKALHALKKCHDIECSVYGANSRKSKETQKTIDLLLLNPNLASKQKKSKQQELKQRPRFSSVARTATVLSGFKPQ